jgi:predicted AAA+ superfamily ATPase
MNTDQQRFRWLSRRLPPADKRRLVVLTGARQVGKTTLARHCWPDLRYLSMDSFEDRDALRAMRSAAWGRSVGPAVLDEAQKEPGLFDKVKFAYDAGDIDFSVLLGSSRLQPLERVRESLAGRAFVYELWPLMALELMSPQGADPAPPLVDALVMSPEPMATLLEAQPAMLLGADRDPRMEALEHLERWGGMPELLRLDDDERREWLRSYQVTFLERDLADLASLRDLLPFRSLQRLAMLRSGQLLSYAELARDAAMSASTARRYLEYLAISYQVVLLPPYSRNLTSTVVKSPKLYWTDIGLLRHGTGQWGPITGDMFETLVVTELHKWFTTAARDVPRYFYRTRSGLEVDLLMETPGGLMGIEIKSRARAHRRDARGLRALAEHLGASWRGGLVVSRGGPVEPIDSEHNIWSVPAHRLLTPGVDK